MPHKEMQAPGFSDFPRTPGRKPGSVANKVCFASHSRAARTSHLPPQEPRVPETGPQPRDASGPAGESTQAAGVS